MKPSYSTDAFTLFGQVETFCRAHKIQPIPLHYMVSYEHLSGNHPQLSEEINQHTSLGHQLNHSYITQLHQEHLVPESQELVEGAHQVREVIDNLLTSVRDSNASVEDLTHSLDQGMDELAKKPALAKLEQVVSNLLQASLNAKQDQQKLRQQLQQAETNAAELQQQLQQSQQQAITDPLTGMLNRAGMNHHLERLRHLDHSQLSLVVFDIDHFKQFNDDHGHLLGDKVLQVVANQIKGAIGEQDLAIRFGGEEMIVILPETGLARAVILADQVLNQVEKINLINKRTKQSLRSVTLSAGVAQIQPQEPWDDLLERADQAMYRAKNNGRNQVQIASA
ncbi:MAG: GGDEF domain-containing protein [Motiliproteus sp.]